MIDLNSEIKFLPGTGPARAEKLFKETGIADCEDLVYFFPYKYIDHSKFYTVREINSDIAFIQLKHSTMIVFQIKGSENNNMKATKRKQ